MKKNTIESTWDFMTSKHISNKSRGKNLENTLFRTSKKKI